jgi:hypothetical protein
LVKQPGRYVAWIFGGATLLLAACEQVLGIEDAHFDPTTSSPSAAGGSSGMPAADGGAQTAGGGSPGSGSGQGGHATQTSAGSSGRAAGGAPNEAGAGGAGEAGAGGEIGIMEPPLCERYCAAMMAGCSQQHAQYIDKDGCLAACAEFAPGKSGDKTGNSANCRLTYAEKASSEPYTYCTWAGPGGDGKCGSNCEGFCGLMMQTCSDETTEPGDYFTSAEQCLSTCQALPDVGSYSATNGSLQMGADHVQCRLYHVGAALAEDDPITHCHHAMGRMLCVNPQP